MFRRTGKKQPFYITGSKEYDTLFEIQGVKHKGDNGRIKKITTNTSRAIGQYIRRQPSISAGSVADKFKDIGVDISRSTGSRHLVDLE
ncbi:14253_t:CDS:2, partial [Funneliformis caledonium]